VRRARGASSAVGQHGLRSLALAQSLVADAGIRRGDLVLDIGAGSGLLTRALAEAGAQVLAVERDPALASRLRARAWPRVEVVCGDARELVLPQEPFAVVANLPFAGASAILAHLLADPATPLRQADVIVEWGMALKRAAVVPSTLRGAFWGAWYETVLVRRLPRRAFTPAPAVDAGVIRIRRRRHPLVAPGRVEEYHTFLREAYSVGRLRGGRPVKSALDRVGAPRDAPATSLDAYQWAELFARVRTQPSAGDATLRRTLPPL
jgi:23S rRNA (adenine-N6)-dimethyltransferase